MQNFPYACVRPSSLDVFYTLFIILYYMKKFFTTFVVAAAAISAFADEYPAEGYYRVSNKATSRYVYVCDNVGSINWSTTSAELGALQLWLDADKRYSDPASIIYVKTIDASEHKYDLQSQSTGVYTIIKHYVSLEATDGGYWVYAEEDGVARYLSDERSKLDREDGQMGTTGKGDFRIWVPTPIDVNGSEYFGIKPILKAGEKYYQPFFAAFPFSFASAGMKAYYIKKVDAEFGVAVIEEYTGEVMAGGVPYIIECSSANTTDNRLNILTSGGVAPADNQLKGCYFFNPDHAKAGKKAYTEFDASTMRLLSVNAEGKFEFITNSDRLEIYEDNEELVGKKFLPANQSYLSVAAGAPETMQVMTEEEYNAYVAGISEVVADREASKAVYSLTSTRVGTSLQGLSAGVYVVDGRKVQVR